jgi:glycine/D-amino acid oxidase-like deaminating enzyme
MGEVDRPQPIRVSVLVRGIRRATPTSEGNCMSTSLWLARRGQPQEPWEADEHPALPGDRADVVVVGAGITGLATGVHLAREGLRPLVLESRWVGAGATGHTTAKLSLLQGSVLSGIREHFDDEVTRAYATGNRAAQDWLLGFLAESGVPVQRRDAFTYAVTPQGADVVDKELQACRAAGIDAKPTTDTGLPFRTVAALRLDEQAQFDPTDVLAALRSELERLGGSVVEGVRVTGVSFGRPPAVTTTAGRVEAGHVVLATGTPILDRGLYFAKLLAHRSYALAYRMPDAGATLPKGMYLSTDTPTHSLRTAPHEDEELLLVGGNGHPVGRHPSPASAIAELHGWASSTFPGAEQLYVWAAQDYQSANNVPFVGPMPRSGGSILVATGYHKWGMTNGVAAAMILTADITGRELDWAKPLRHRITGPRDVATGLGFNAHVAMRMASDWARTAWRARPGVPAPRPQEGEGDVESRAFPPVAVSTVDGCTRRVDGTCSHMGGILSWNDAEQSWDCPLHGSRFTPDGHQLEGPATKDLRRR